jgi:hypothetical protein
MRYVISDQYTIKPQELVIDVMLENVLSPIKIEATINGNGIKIKRNNILSDFFVKIHLLNLSLIEPKLIKRFSRDSLRQERHSVRLSSLSRASISSSCSVIKALEHFEQTAPHRLNKIVLEKFLLLLR